MSKSRTKSDPSLDPSGELPLRPAAYHILLALADRERHGYEIMKEAERLSGGRVRLGPGTLYRSIQELLQAGWLEESDERPDPELDDERRRYYRMSSLGRRLARAETQRLADLVRVAIAKRLVGAKLLEAR